MSMRNYDSLAGLYTVTCGCGRSWDQKLADTMFCPRCLCRPETFKMQRSTADVTKKAPAPSTPAKVHAKGVKIPTHRMCSGCGELFQPLSPSQKVCDKACEPVADIEAAKAREHQEKLRRGLE